MRKPYKIVEKMQYTETVYYDENDVEVHRERNMDDSWHDSSDAEYLTDDEMEDIFPEGRDD